MLRTPVPTALLWLPPMLLGVQRKRGVERCIIQTIDGKQAALFF